MRLPRVHCGHFGATMPGHWTRRSLTAAIFSVPSLAGFRTPPTKLVQGTKYGSAYMTSESVELRVGGLKTVCKYDDKGQAVFDVKINGHDVTARATYKKAGANFSFALKRDKKDISPPMWRVATGKDSEYLYRFLKRDLGLDNAVLTNSYTEPLAAFGDNAIAHATQENATNEQELKKLEQLEQRQQRLEEYEQQLEQQHEKLGQLEQRQQQLEKRRQQLEELKAKLKKLGQLEQRQQRLEEYEQQLEEFEELERQHKKLGQLEQRQHGLEELKQQLAELEQQLRQQQLRELKPQPRKQQRDQQQRKQQQQEQQLEELKQQTGQQLEQLKQQLRQEYQRSPHRFWKMRWCQHSVPFITEHGDTDTKQLMILPEVRKELNDECETRKGSGTRVDFLKDEPLDQQNFQAHIEKMLRLITERGDYAPDCIPILESLKSCYDTWTQLTAEEQHHFRSTINELLPQLREWGAMCYRDAEHGESGERSDIISPCHSSVSTIPDDELE